MCQHGLYVNRIIRHVPFHVWLLFTQHSFEIYAHCFVVGVDALYCCIVFIHSTVNEMLGDFQVGWISDKIDVFCVSPGVYSFSFLLSKCLGVELLSHQVYFSFDRYSQTVFQIAFTGFHGHPPCMRADEFILPKNALKSILSQVSISGFISSK